MDMSVPGRHLYKQAAGNKGTVQDGRESGAIHMSDSHHMKHPMLNRTLISKRH